jgi:hypothetical protein
MEGPQNLKEVLGKARGPISLHTCISEEVQRQLANTPFVEKEEAREVGLCREVHLGLQMSVNQNTNFKQGEPISSYQEEMEERERERY